MGERDRLVLLFMSPASKVDAGQAEEPMTIVVTTVMRRRSETIGIRPS